MGVDLAKVDLVCANLPNLPLSNLTEVCKLVVHRRRQIGSGSQALNYVGLSESKANSLHSSILLIALDNQPANLCTTYTKLTTYQTYHLPPTTYHTYHTYHTLHVPLTLPLTKITTFHLSNLPLTKLTTFHLSNLPLTKLTT